jgi:hypothetical protein
MIGILTKILKEGGRYGYKRTAVGCKKDVGRFTGYSSIGGT